MSGTISKLNYSHYVCFPNDGRRHEIIDREHYVNPAPSTYHQTVSRRIQFALYSAIELKGLGQVFNAPVDVQLGHHNIIQPDIVVILAAHQQMITPTKIKGIPDLLVEILQSYPNNQSRVGSALGETHWRWSLANRSHK